MNFKSELWLKRYEAAIKVTESCRAREFTMLNFTIIIFTASVWFIYQVKNDSYQLFGIWLLGIIIALIGLFIAKLNAVEQMHHYIEKNIYIRAGLTTYNSILSNHKKGFNKRILMMIYIVLLLSLLGLSSFILYRILISSSILLYSFCLYVVIGLLVFFIYGRCFWNIIEVSKDTEEKIIETDKNIKIE